MPDASQEWAKLPIFFLASIWNMYGREEVMAISSCGAAGPMGKDKPD
jgi:hypothetical protein